MSLGQTDQSVSRILDPKSPSDLAIVGGHPIGHSSLLLSPFSKELLLPSQQLEFVEPDRVVHSHSQRNRVGKLSGITPQSFTFRPSMAGLGKFVCGG